MTLDQCARLLVASKGPLEERGGGRREEGDMELLCGGQDGVLKKSPRPSSPSSQPEGKQAGMEGSSSSTARDP